MPELTGLRRLDREGLIGLVDSRADARTASAGIVDEYEVDAGLYEFVYGLLHPGHDVGISTVSARDKAMQAVTAMRRGAENFVTLHARISQRDQPF